MLSGCMPLPCTNYIIVPGKYSKRLGSGHVGVYIIYKPIEIDCF